jgi:hypothetical protein
MKIFISFILLISSTIVFGQQSDSLGLGDNAFLNKSELNYIDSLFQNDPITNFKDQKILFFTTKPSIKIITKKEFFDTLIQPSRNKNKLPHFSTQSQTKEQKEESGGYDVIFIAPSGNISDKERSKQFKQLKKG